MTIVAGRQTSPPVSLTNGREKEKLTLKDPAFKAFINLLKHHKEVWK